MTESEVARLKRQIAAEYQAAQQGLTGLAHGTARHAFITARLENMEKCRQQLTTLVGEQACTKLLHEALENL